MHSEFQSRRMATFAAMLVCMLFALLFEQSTAKAQLCQNTHCSGVTIYNCTSIDFRMKFKLCCNGVVSASPTVVVPATPCPTPATTVSFAPCTILGIVVISPTPPPGINVVYDPVSCVVKIY